MTRPRLIILDESFTALGAEWKVAADCHVRRDGSIDVEVTHAEGRARYLPGAVFVSRLCRLEADLLLEFLESRAREVVDGARLKLVQGGI